MHYPDDQAAFFNLLAKLLHYVASGRSHVGYMSNNPGNMLVKQVWAFVAMELMAGL